MINPENRSVKNRTLVNSFESIHLMKINHSPSRPHRMYTLRGETFTVYVTRTRRCRLRFRGDFSIRYFVKSTLSIERIPTIIPIFFHFTHTSVHKGFYYLIAEKSKKGPFSLFIYTYKHFFFSEQTFFDVFGPSVGKVMSRINR